MLHTQDRLLRTFLRLSLEQLQISILGIVELAVFAGISYHISRDIRDKLHVQLADLHIRLGAFLMLSSYFISPYYGARTMP